MRTKREHTKRHRHRTFTAAANGMAVSIVIAIGLGSCATTNNAAPGPDSAPSSNAGTTETPTVATSRPTLSTSPVTSQLQQGCTTGPANIPSGATTGRVVDVDGDTKPDSAWILTASNGSTTVGVATAAGGGAVRSFDSASPVSRSILVVDADQQPPVEIFADTGRSVQLWAFQNCEIVDVQNAQGKRYDFSLGFTDIGSGVGCVTIAGRQQLVGLDAEEHGDTVDWSRTIVTLDGTQARNGATSNGVFTRPADDHAIDLLHQVTCGDLTMQANGLRSNK